MRKAGSWMKETVSWSSDWGRVGRDGAVLTAVKGRGGMTAGTEKLGWLKRFGEEGSGRGREMPSVRT